VNGKLGKRNLTRYEVEMLVKGNEALHECRNSYLWKTKREGRKERKKNDF